MDVRLLRDDARDVHLSWTTLKRVKEEAGVISRKNGDGGWSWSLKKSAKRSEPEGFTMH